MWPGSWWVAVTCVAVAAEAHYSDYSNAKMPEYAGGDYDASRDSGSRATAPDYYREQAADPLHTHETHSSDYKYEEETGVPRKHVDLEDAEMWQNPTKNKKSASRIKSGTLDYNSDEIDLKLSNRPPKYRPRNKMRGSQDDDAHRYPFRYGRYEKKDASDINVNIDFQNEDRKIDLHDDNSDYIDKLSHIGTTARIIRRKPRDRYVKPPMADEDAAHTPKSELIDDERNSIPRNSIPLERKSIKRVGADLVKPKPKVKLYGEYEDYYDMKRVLGIKQKLSKQGEGKDFHSNNNAPDFSTRATHTADRWPKRSGGGKLAAEKGLLHTSMKQIEDSLQEDPYLKTYTANSLNTGFTLPYSPYLRKQMGCTLMKNNKLEPYLRKQNIGRDAEHNFKMTDVKVDFERPYLVTMKETTEQGLVLSYSQHNFRKQMADTAKADFKSYLRKHERQNAREDFDQPNLKKQNTDIAKKSFEPLNPRPNLSERMYLDDMKVTSSWSDLKEFELPLKKPSYEDQAANTENELPNARPMQDVEEKDFELPYTRPSHTEEMRNPEYIEFKVPYQQPSPEDPMADPKKEDFDTRLLYTRPSHTEEMVNPEYMEFKVPYQRPSPNDQIADFYTRADFKGQMAKSGKKDLEMPKPFPTDTEQNTEATELEIPNPRYNPKQHIMADDKKKDLTYPQSSLRGQIADTEKENYDMPYPRPSVKSQMVEARKKGFGMPNSRLGHRDQIADTEQRDYEMSYPQPSIKDQMADIGYKKFVVPKPGPNHRDKIVDTEQVDYEITDQWQRVRGQIAEIENKDFRIPNPPPGHRDQITETEQEDYQMSNPQSNLENEIVGMARPQPDKEKNNLRGEWANLLDDPSRPTEKNRLFSEGRRNFEDSVNINNIADYGNYNYDTEPAILTEKHENETNNSLAFKSILNTTTTTVTTTAPSVTASTTTTTRTSTTMVPDLVVVDEVRRQSDANKLELSLAEKSRMSILKKSLRKEMSKDLGTTKPPVLMQVTNKLYTMVMVEPPTSPKPWQRVQVVSDDSPDHLKNVKRLMRHKLIANAKNVHDLTENWDDMVCDYVDMSLLSDMKRSAATVNKTNVYTIILSFIINLQYWKMGYNYLLQV